MSTKIIKSIQPIDFNWETDDPFLFCAYHNDYYPKGNADYGPDASLAGRNIGMDFEIRDGWRMYHGDRVPGFPVHPHRGFETVTIVQHGLIDHADSMGAAGRYGDGDVQWMTAGKGVQHSEMFPLVNRDSGNHLELFQVWLNLPSSHKMADPHFSMFWARSIPKIEHEDNTGAVTKIDVIAGSLDGVDALPPPPNSWAAIKKSQVLILTIVMAPNASWTLPGAVAGPNRNLYYYRGGGINIAGQDLTSMQRIGLHPDSDVELVNGATESRLLLLQGNPIGEPVEQYGPFVMNSIAEIHQTIEEYNKTRFGGWPWDRRDPVHFGKPCFAQHADGRKEYKD